ncbi:hypothetical protein, partial [Arthrobacter sp.]|uniref:hypothetical protein n=1 Tax=Arthrobacter sp. TaxID=1667 RepID=UPI0028A1E811
TPDPLHAMQVRYQLRHSPEKLLNSAENQVYFQSGFFPPGRSNSSTLVHKRGSAKSNYMVDIRAAKGGSLEATAPHLTCDYASAAGASGS